MPPPTRPPIRPPSRPPSQIPERTTPTQDFSRTHQSTPSYPFRAVPERLRQGVPVTGDHPRQYGDFVGSARFTTRPASARPYRAGYDNAEVDSPLFHPTAFSQPSETSQATQPFQNPHIRHHSTFEASPRNEGAVDQLAADVGTRRWQSPAPGATRRDSSADHFTSDWRTIDAASPEMGSMAWTRGRYPTIDTDPGALPPNILNSAHEVPPAFNPYSGPGGDTLRRASFFVSDPKTTEQIDRLPLLERPESANNRRAAEHDHWATPSSQTVGEDAVPTKKRPASRQARPQSAPKKPRKANQGRSVRRPETAQPSQMVTTRSRAAQAEANKASKGTEALSATQPLVLEPAAPSVTEAPQSGETGTKRQKTRIAEPREENFAGLTFPRVGMHETNGGPTQLTEKTANYAENVGREFATSACILCRQKNLPCDLLRPMCSACSNSGSCLCTYPGEQHDDQPDETQEDQRFRAADDLLSKNNGGHTQANDGTRPSLFTADRPTAHGALARAQGKAVEMANAGTSTSTCTCSNVADAAVQTDVPEGAQVGLLQWRYLVTNGMALEMAHLEKAARYQKDADCCADLRQRTLIAARCAREFQQNLLDLFRNRSSTSR